MEIQCKNAKECTGYQEFCFLCDRNYLADNDFTVDCFEDNNQQ